jgi:hypothetical protein
MCTAAAAFGTNIGMDYIGTEQNYEHFVIINK